MHGRKELLGCWGGKQCVGRGVGCSCLDPTTTPRMEATEGASHQHPRPYLTSRAEHTTPFLPSLPAPHHQHQHRLSIQAPREHGIASIEPTKPNQTHPAPPGSSNLSTLPSPSPQTTASPGAFLARSNFIRSNTIQATAKGALARPRPSVPSPAGAVNTLSLWRSGCLPRRSVQYIAPTLPYGRFSRSSDLRLETTGGRKHEIGYRDRPSSFLDGVSARLSAQHQHCHNPNTLSVPGPSHTRQPLPILVPPHTGPKNAGPDRREIRDLNQLSICTAAARQLPAAVSGLRLVPTTLEQTSTSVASHRISAPHRVSSPN
jgi:hypothetical protein